jgi:uncharacterized membrane protein
MRSLTTAIAAAVFFTAAAVHAQSPRYLLNDLGPLPGASFSQASDVTDSGIVAGVSTTAEGAQHAVVWIKGRPFDLSASRLGGPNSGAFGINEWGQMSMQAETGTPDPFGEDFCAYGTHLTCLAVRWDFGFFTTLKTLGGANATVGNVNNIGQIPGAAETATVDSSCSTGAPFQMLRYKPVIWDPGTRVPRQLALPHGDTVGYATVINDRSQAVGFTGSCGNSALPPIAFGPRAVLWEPDGSVRDLGNLGAPVLNISLSINNHSQVVGTSSLASDSRPFYKIHAFGQPHASAVDHGADAHAGEHQGNEQALDLRTLRHRHGLAVPTDGALTVTPTWTLVQQHWKPLPPSPVASFACNRRT